MPDNHRTLFGAVFEFVTSIYGKSHRPVRIKIVLENGESYLLPIPTFPPEPAAKNTHSPDFRSICWGGVNYTFTPTQAQVVKLLWEALDNNTPEVSQEYLLTEVDSNASRLAVIFQDHPAWGQLIIPGSSKGNYKLSN